MIVQAPRYGIQAQVFRRPSDLDVARARLYGRPVDPLPDVQTGRTVEIRVGDRATYLIGWFDGKRSTLAHEAGHVAFMAFERLGLDPRIDNGEEHCRLASDLFELLGGDDSNG